MVVAAERDYKTDLDLRRALTDSPPYGRSPLKINCLWHDDTIASAAVYPDGFHCHSCGYNCGPLQFLATLKGLDLVTESAAVRAEADRLCELGPAEQRATPQPVTADLSEKVETWAEAQYHSREQFNYWRGRGFTPKTILDARLGHTGRAYVLPLYDRFGQLFSVKYRRDDALDPNAPKYWTHPGTGRTAVYYPPLRDWSQFTKPVVLCEGELDALLLAQRGVPAVSVNNGVNAVAAMLPELLEWHGGIVLCLDNDEPGQKPINDLVERGAADRIVGLRWNPPYAYKDVGEAFQAGQGEALLAALRDCYGLVVRRAGGNYGSARTYAGRHGTDH